MKRVYRIIPSLLLMISGSFPSAHGQHHNASPAPVEIKITARQFEFEPKTITVRKGQPVKLIITSVDVSHGFAISEFNIKEKIKAHTTKTIEFTPDRTGEFQFYCSVYCGDDHEDMEGKLIVTEAQSESGGSGASDMQVTFEKDAPGVVIVESRGERIRIDTSTKTVTRIEAPPAPEATKTQEEEAAAVATARVEQKGRHAREPYDYRLVNVPTPKRVVRRSLNLYFTHRFSEPVRPLRESGRDLLGLDSFSVSSLGLFYGITDKLYVSANRSPLCQTALCKTIEIGVGYHWLDEGGRSPLALSTYASMEGDNNFTGNYTYNLQAMLGRSVTKYAHVFFSPAVHINSNGQHRFNPQPDDFFLPLLPEARLKLAQHTVSFGFGVNVRVRPSTSLLFEYTPRAGFKLGVIEPIFNSTFTAIEGFKNTTEAEIGFGVERRIGRHSFSLTFSNTQTTTTSRYNSSNLGLPPKRFIIGFNLYRRFFK
jgi:cytochrome c oxidase subunit 2